MAAAKSEDPAVTAPAAAAPSTSDAPINPGVAIAAKTGSVTFKTKSGVELKVETK